jgi:hypothetical protein
VHWRSGGLEVVRAVSSRISTAGKRRLPVHAATVILEEADPEFDDPVAIGRISGQGRGPDRNLIWVMEARVSDRLWSLDELVERTSV